MIEIRLTPEGNLRMLSDGSDVILPTDPEKAVAILQRTAQAQANMQTIFAGNAARPSQHDVDHAFDKARGRGRAASHRVVATYPDGAVVRVLATKSRKIKAREISLEELGL